MTSTLIEISQRADKMFTPELAAEILGEADRDNLSGTDPSDILEGAESLLTFFAGDRLYNNTRSGHFEGLPNISWNGMFDDGTPKFIYHENAGGGFRFVRHDGRAIEPRAMDTDGGSIPRILHGLTRFDPWGYAPGYMVHDWIFVAHKCNHAPDDDISFEDSATILAECIKTQMEIGFTDFDGNSVRFEKDEDTMYLIYKAVSSSIARNIWDDPASTTCR